MSLPGKRLIILLVLAVVTIGLTRYFTRVPTRRASAGDPAAQHRELLAKALIALEEQEAQIAAKHWGPELLAQKHGAVFEQLWDRLNASDKFTVLKEFAVPKLIWAQRATARQSAHGIQVLDPSSEKITLDAAGFRGILEEKQAQGWRLIQFEFRHIGFSLEKPESTFYFSAHALHSAEDERVILEGNLIVNWNRGESPTVAEIDATNVQVRSRKGAVPFPLIFDQEFIPPTGTYFIDPLIVSDLDGDGSSEIILAARNEIFRRDERGEWKPSRFCEDEPRLIFTGLLADLNGDGAKDFLNAKFDGLFLHEGVTGGKFPSPARLVWKAEPRLKYAQVSTCGDIDGDGDLDLFLGQYKTPFTNGSMPFPYFDANDGYPSFLLLNDGKGNFTDSTEASGLAAKKNRRVYSSSFIDLDGDNDLDLLVASDFAGLDAFENDGKGHFIDATAKWFSERHSFGMAHCFSDFNADGRLDILLIGMNSPTADRLESMKLSRPYDSADADMRAKVSHGNRLYFGNASGRFEETPLSALIARTGWSWGCSAADFDRDGFPDIFVANGHASRKSVRDYETEFWLHDIYVGNSRENPLPSAYFDKKLRKAQDDGWSYGGYEKNRFFVNEGGTNFTEAAFLLGLALEADSRNVVARDLTSDGKPELVLTTFEAYPQNRQTLKIYENRLEAKAGTNLVREFKVKVTGDSYRSQSD